MKKKMISLLLVLALVVGICPAAFAAPIVVTEMEEIYAIARNAPLHYLPTANWTDVDIVKTTPLFDLDGNIVAYCIDLYHAETDAYAYVFVNADPKGYPILQYSPDGTSPYYNETSGRALFLSAGQYLIEHEETITVLNTNETVSKTAVLEQYEQQTKEIAYQLNAETREKQDFSAYRANYIAGIAPLAFDTKEKTLSKVPNWQWRKGCAPTAVAMQIANLLPTVPANRNDMIDKLAEYMKTDSVKGTTDFKDITKGAQNYVADCNFTKTTIALWEDETWSGTPRLGPDYNPYSSFVSEINYGRAVCIYSANATIQTTGYDGWGAHMITGIGYCYSTVNSQEKSVIVYTTNVADGRVYIPIYGTALGDYAWFKIVQ